MDLQPSPEADDERNGIFTVGVSTFPPEMVVEEAHLSRC